MDRSGTSLCTQILHLLGMELDDDLMPSDHFNPNGYFESPAIYRCNEDLLLALGSHWDEIRTLRPLNPAWWRQPVALETERRLTELVRAHLHRHPGVWGFKDPRTAGLLPLWQRVFRNCGVQPIYVMTVRHPAAVASSLAVRDSVPRKASELLWLERYLQACSILGSQIRCVVHYEDWFTSPVAQARRLLEATGLEWPSTEAELEQTLRSVADHCLAHEAPGEIETDAVRCLYQYLRDRSQPPPPEFLEKFVFALRLSGDYAGVAGELLGHPLIGGASLLSRQAELAELHPAPAEAAAIELPAPAAVPPAAELEPPTDEAEPAPEQPPETTIEQSSAEAWIVSEIADETAGESSPAAPPPEVAPNIETCDEPALQHTHANGLG